MKLASSYTGIPIINLRYTPCEAENNIFTPIFKNRPKSFLNQVASTSFVLSDLGMKQPCGSRGDVDAASATTPDTAASTICITPVNSLALNCCYEPLSSLFILYYRVCHDDDDAGPPKLCLLPSPLGASVTTTINNSSTYDK